MKEIAKEFFSFLFEILKTVTIAALIVIPIRYFLFQPFIVRGDSMLPNFENGDYLIIDEISFRLKEPKRGEVIVFAPPNQPATRYIKRIIGLPGETIQIKDGKITIFEKSGDIKILDEESYLPNSDFTSGNLKVALGEKEYFVLGDNRQFSSDSRIFGALPKENIVGKVFLKAFPFTKISRAQAPSY